MENRNITQQDSADTLNWGSSADMRYPTADEYLSIIADELNQNAEWISTLIHDIKADTRENPTLDMISRILIRCEMLDCEAGDISDMSDAIWNYKEDAWKEREAILICVQRGSGPRFL